MQNIEVLPDKFGNAINKTKDDEVWYSTIDLEYAYSQLNSDPEISKNCNFNIVGDYFTDT